MRCVLDPGDSIVDCPPTFTMYVFDAAVNDARVVTVPRLDGFRLDVEGAHLAAALACTCGRMLVEAHVLLVLHARAPKVGRRAEAQPSSTTEAVCMACRGRGSGQAAQTKDRVPDVAQQPRRQHHQRGACAPAHARHPHCRVLHSLLADGRVDMHNVHAGKCSYKTKPLVCHPARQGDLLRVLALPVLVVLDEAYVDFSTEPSRLDWVLRHDNLVVLRTFSKSAGLAGAEGDIGFRAHGRICVYTTLGTGC